MRACSFAPLAANHTQCGHRLCQACLDKVITVAARPDDKARPEKARCPLCNEHIPARRTTKADELWAQAVDAARPSREEASDGGEDDFMAEYEALAALARQKLEAAKAPPAPAQVRGWWCCGCCGSTPAPPSAPVPACMHAGTAVPAPLLADALQRHPYRCGLTPCRRTLVSQSACRSNAAATRQLQRARAARGSVASGRGQTKPQAQRRLRTRWQFQGGRPRLRPRRRRTAVCWAPGRHRSRRAARSALTTRAPPALELSTAAAAAAASRLRCECQS
jgi:hypothetical protein